MIRKQTFGSYEKCASPTLYSRIKYVTMKYKIIFTLTTLLLFVEAQGQLFDSDVYNVNPWIDGPVTLAAIGTNFWGLKITDQKPHLDSLEINQLDVNDINSFDRSATRQDPSYVEQALKISDIGMRGSFLLPALLMLDKEIRQDWAPVLLLFLQAEAITGSLFSWGAAMHIDRIRPLVYHPDVEYESKTFYRNKNSFFSGHTSTSATASFYTAKVYCDYHPELGPKKLIFYGLALIPPAFTGYYRYKGMKHFPTDVLTGLAVGAAVGILVPHLHKKRKNENLTWIPVTGRYTGFAMSLTF
jgi:membrane-associated phospholipid phosphatase